MWWFIIIVVITTFALFGEVNVENTWNRTIFEIRLKSEWPKFDICIFKVWKTSRWWYGE